MAETAVRSARVVAVEANFCRVRLDAPGPDGIEDLLCVRRSRLERQGCSVVAGDRVRLEAIDWWDRRAAIVAREPRSTHLGRPAVANCTAVHVVASLCQPDPDPDQITRFLVTAEATGLPVHIVLTKSDLVATGHARAWRARLQAWGYAVTTVSCRTGAGLSDYGAALRRSAVTVFCGPSGAGKSSLLNALVPSLDVRVGEVSGRLRRGRHTTRHVELFPVGEGSLVADTPGFNRPALPSCPGDLARLFPEIRARLASGRCRFRDCLHNGEPGCLVGGAWERAPLYRRCLREILAEGAGRRERVPRTVSRPAG